MRTEKKVIEFADYIVTIIVRPKNPPKANNDNEPYDFGVMNSRNCTTATTSRAYYDVRRMGKACTTKQLAYGDRGRLFRFADVMAWSEKISL